MTIGCNIWMICLILIWFFIYGLSRMYHLSDFVWILHSSVLVVFNNFLLIDATEKSRISSDQKHFFIALSLYPLSFFANTPFKAILKWILGYYKAYSCSSKLLNHFLSEMGLFKLHHSCAAYSLDYLKLYLDSKVVFLFRSFLVITVGLA